MPFCRAQRYNQADCEPDTRTDRPEDMTSPQPKQETTGTKPASAHAPRADAARQQDMRPARPRSRYIPALDGIRTLAVAAVVLYHLGFSWIQGGLQGVTMFFVLSGYLITHLLIVEYRGTGRIDLKDFWIRRIRRLLPAVLTVIVATIILCALFNHVMLTKMRPDIIPSILFFNNWWQILRNVSYFDALGDPSPLTHFWSLAIEEQFYLIWPLLLMGVWKLGGKNKHVRRGTLVLTIVSAVAMTALYDPSVDPSRVYYGTDTRVFSLLLGAWLAFIPTSSMRLGWLAPYLRKLSRRLGKVAGERKPAESHRAGAPHPTYRMVAQKSPDAIRGEQKRADSPWPIDVIGLLSLVALIAIMALTNGYTAFQYQGGTLLCSLLTVALVAACVQPDTLLSRVFSLPPLVWLGKRSYGIYLWHYPLLLLMNPVSDISEKPWWVYIIQIALVILAAELSYRFIETPFRHGLFGKIVKQLRGSQEPGRLARKHPLPVAATTLVLVAAVAGLVLVPDTSALSAEGAALLEQGTDDGQDAAGTEGQADGAPADQDDGETTAAEPQGAYDIVMIGDSVSVRVIPAFEEKFPHGYIDAAKNRQFGTGIEIYQSLVDQNLAGGILVFALGTNGPMSDEQIDTLMGIAGADRTVVFVNTRSPQPWTGPTNETLARAAERYPNVRIVDWYGYSEGRNDVFDGDGTHLNESGAVEYVDLIYSAVEDILPVHLDDPELQQELQSRMQSVTDGIRTSLTDSMTSVLLEPYNAQE